MSAGVVAIEGGRLLLVRRADDGCWCLPGGRLEVGESVRGCAQREFAEETGHAVELGALLGVYSDPETQTHRYPGGELVQFVAVVFEGRCGAAVGPIADDVIESAWCPPDALPEPIMATDACIIRDALAGATRPVVT